MSRPLNSLCRVMGHVVVLIGGLMMFGGLLGIIDPGIKQADDADPFGVPPSSIDDMGSSVRRTHACRSGPLVGDTEPACGSVEHRTFAVVRNEIIREDRMHLRHYVLVVVAAGVLSGCEVTEARYQDKAEIVSRNALQAGWFPEWIPGDAFDIRETHDSDTNESWLVFRVRSGHWKNPDECTSQASPELSSARVMQRFPRFARDAWQRVGERTGEIHTCPGRRWVMWDQEHALVYSWTRH